MSSKKQVKKAKVKKQTKKVAVRGAKSTRIEKRKVRKIRYSRVFLYVILPICLFVLVCSCIEFRIQNIFIRGNEELTDQEIIELAGIADYPSIFKYTTGELTKKLEANRYIVSVTIKKKKLREIHIEVVENIPLFYDVSSNQTIFSDGRTYDGNDSNCTLLNYTPEEDMNLLIDGISGLDSDVRKRISEIQYVPNDADDERFLLTMNDGNYVYITLGKFDILNTYIDIIKNFDGKRGILYLDSGEYFEIKE